MLAVDKLPPLVPGMTGRGQPDAIFDPGTVNETHYWCPGSDDDTLGVIVLPQAAKARADFHPATFVTDVEELAELCANSPNVDRLVRSAGINIGRVALKGGRDALAATFPSWERVAQNDAKLPVKVVGIVARNASDISARDTLETIRDKRAFTVANVPSGDKDDLRYELHDRFVHWLAWRLLPPVAMDRLVEYAANKLEEDDLTALYHPGVTSPAGRYMDTVDGVMARNDYFTHAINIIAMPDLADDHARAASEALYLLRMSNSEPPISPDAIKDHLFALLAAA